MSTGGVAPGLAMIVSIRADGIWSSTCLLHNFRPHLHKIIESLHVPSKTSVSLRVQ